jgi:hypothetical protein
VPGWISRRGNRSSGSSSRRTNEHELDMRRETEVRPAILPFVLERFSERLRWLLPARAPIGPPTRSVDRDLEETWPSRGSGF